MENGTVGAACIYIENMADLQNKAVNIFAFLLWQSTVVDTLDQNISWYVYTDFAFKIKVEHKIT